MFGLMGIYTLGANQFALAYEYADYDNAPKQDTITLQALHNLSDNMYIYVEGYLGGGDDNAYGIADKSERSVAAVGATYYF